VILVDGVTEHEATGLRHKRWSHLVSTTDETELHQFAARLGLRRAWAQLRPASSAAHYDVTPPKRALALRLGAKEVTGRVLVRLNYDGMTRRGLRGDAERVAADLEAERLAAEVSP
jgi:hypothetical protein